MKEKDLLKKAFEPYMPDIEKVRQNCISRESEATSIKQSRQLFRMKHIIPVTACLLFTILAFSIIPRVNSYPVNDDSSLFNHVSETNTVISSASAVSNPPAKQESQAEIPKSEISINEITNVPYEKNYFCLHREDFIEMSNDDMYEYYGFNFYPTYLPDGFSCSNENRSFVRCRSCTNLCFSNSDNTKYIRIEVDKDKLPYFAEYYLKEKMDTKKSVINNNELFIGHYILQKKDCYYAEFTYKKVGFRIFSGEISKDDFIAVVSSILK